MKIFGKISCLVTVVHYNFINLRSFALQHIIVYFTSLIKFTTGNLKTF